MADDQRPAPARVASPGLMPDPVEVEKELRDDLMAAVEARFRRIATDEAPTADAEKLWRAPGVWTAQTVAEGFAACRDPRVVFRYDDATAMADHYLRVAEWCQLCPVPSIAAAGVRLEGAVIAYMTEGIPLGQSLGIEPVGSGGKSLSLGIRLRCRNTLLRRLYRSDPGLRGLPPRKAARNMRAAFLRYEADAWPRDRKADDPPDDAWKAVWWRILKLGLAVSVPGVNQLAGILGG